MADQNVTIADILAAVQEQKGLASSMSTMLAGIHARVNQLVSGQIDPQTQANINEAFAEIKGNSNALAQAINTYSPDQQAGLQPKPAAPIATSTTISTAKATVNVGEAISLSAGVSASAPSASAAALTGSVTFSTSSEKLGTTGLDSTGVAALSVTDLPAGDYLITATYGGDANYEASTSSPVSQSVLAVPAANPAPQGATGGTSTAAAGGEGQMAGTATQAAGATANAASTGTQSAT